MQKIFENITTGLRNYMADNNLTKVLVGSSGGLDSALTLALAVLALGADKVESIALPSQFSSEGSVPDARMLANNLNIPFSVINIDSVTRAVEEAYRSAYSHIQGSFDPMTSLSKENIQARSRGILLMARANNTNALLLTTSNKSELSVGFCTLYGDMCGGLNLLGDLYKTQVYELSRYVNENYGNPIPPHIISKAPSAELSANQKDTDTLPEYSVLDKILQGGSSGNPALDAYVQSLVDRAVFKQNQMAPIISSSTGQLSSFKSIKAEAYNFDSALVIGRWQPLHNGHMDLLEQAYLIAKSVIVCVGSSDNYPDPKNPLTDSQRIDIIKQSLSPEQLQRTHFIRMTDLYNMSLWKDELLRQVSELNLGDVVLVGFDKDESSDYLYHLGLPLHIVPQKQELNASDIRKALFEGELSSIKSLVPPASYQYLKDWVAGEEFSRLQKEFHALIEYRSKYTQTAYYTSDVVLEVNGHILLIQRGGEFGKGSLALPGGFVEYKESPLGAALRELREETSLKLKEFDLLDALKNHIQFDHPNRSQRGRIITDAYYFKLDLPELPSVQAADDARAAFWIPKGEALSKENAYFEDHKLILSRFLG